MNQLPFRESEDLPLTTDYLIEERVENLFGTATRRQLWILPLDGEARQLPVLVPLADLPERPVDPEDSGLGPLFRMLADQHDAVAIVAVLERLENFDALDEDLEWAHALFRTSIATAVPLRAALILGTDGVFLISPHDYVGLD